MHTIKVNSCKYLKVNPMIIECEHPHNLNSKATCDNPCVFLLEDKIDSLEKKIDQLIEERDHERRRKQY